MPCTDPVIVTAVEKPSSYPFFFIIGMSMLPMAVVSAAEDPEMPPKNIEARILTIARPPRIQPTSELAKLTSLSAMPPAAMMSPASTKKGTARRTKTLSPFTMFCATICNGRPR